MIQIEGNLKNYDIEILLDSQGIDEFIEYLNYIRNHNESFHLVIGSELTEKEPRQKWNNLIKHVKLIYVE